MVAVLLLRDQHGTNLCSLVAMIKLSGIAISIHCSCHMVGSRLWQLADEAELGCIIHHKYQVYKHHAQVLSDSLLCSYNVMRCCDQATGLVLLRDQLLSSSMDGNIMQVPLR